MLAKRIIHIAFVALCIGRAWLLFKKPAPITSFFYHPYLEDFWATITNQNVEEFLASPTFRENVILFVQIIGIYLILVGLASFAAQKLALSWHRILSYSTFGILVFISFCFYLSKQNQLVQFFEYASQMAMPLLFYHIVIQEKNNSKISFWIKIAVALTFVCHGLYALGFYPQPGHFIDMMIQGFGVSESAAKSLLIWAGVLDFIFAIGLFIPNNKVYKISLIYLFLWGLATTFARLVCNVDVSLGWYSWNQWLPEWLVRFPHFALPLFLLFAKKATQN